MIIVCPQCKASFLVPASLFNKGAGRVVRCAKCSHTWREAPAPKTPSFTPPSQPEKSPSAPFRTLEPAAPLSPQEPPKPTPPLRERFKGLWDKLRKMIILGVLTAAGLLVFLLASLFAGQRYIVKTWPSALPYYQAVGLTESADDTPLVIRNIKSERHYADGAMQLSVSGEIFNQTKTSHPVPLINVDALGPDERIIQSWRIKPTAATLGADSALPFSSSIISPEGTVVEVNLSFVEPAHD